MSLNINNAKIICLACVLTLSVLLIPQGNAESSQSVKPAEQLLKEFFSNTDSLTADFSQITLDEKGQQIEEQEAAGVFVLQRPGKFRWHAVSPSELVLLADGKNFWNYDVDLEQVIVKPINETLSNTPAMLLSGEADVLEAFDIGSSFGTTLDIGNIQWIQLTPKDRNADFSRLSIGFLGEDIRLMELATNVGQVVRVELTNMERNPELLDSIFRFVIPKDVDLIGTPL